MTQLQISDTTFRDAHQSLIATRLSIEDMTPIASLMDSVGYYSMEVWGGATFDTTHRFLTFFTNIVTNLNLSDIECFEVILLEVR